MAERQYRIEHLDAFDIIGFDKTFDKNNAQSDIPAFWDNIMSEGTVQDENGNKTIYGLKRFGDYALCIDSPYDNTITYVIGTKLRKKRPEEMQYYHVPENDYLIVDIEDIDDPEEISTKIHETTSYIFYDWLVNNRKYEISGNTTIEYYNMEDENKKVSIMVPIKEVGPIPENALDC